MALKSTICVTCGMEISAKNYKRHYMTHVEGTYECPKCDKKCSTKMALYAHIKDVHSPKLICECCNKTFSAKRNLIDHLKNVTIKWPLTTLRKLGMTFT